MKGMAVLNQQSLAIGLGYFLQHLKRDNRILFLRIYKATHKGSACMSLESHDLLLGKTYRIQKSENRQ